MSCAEIGKMKCWKKSYGRTVNSGTLSTPYGCRVRLVVLQLIVGARRRVVQQVVERRLALNDVSPKVEELFEFETDGLV